MASINTEIEIAAPIEYVFEWGTSPENWMRSMPAITDIEVIEETDEGTVMRNTFTMLGRTTTSEGIYTVDSENFRTVTTFDDEDTSGELVYEFTETDAGTRVRLSGELETGSSMFDRALKPVVARYMRRQFKNSMRTMKDLIEAEHTVEVAA